MLPPVQLPPLEQFRFTVELHTRWSDEDNQGVLNNAVYLTLLEEARLAYFGGLGLLAEGQFPFVLAQCNLRFVRPGRGGERWRASVRTTHLGNSSLEQAYRLVNSAGECMAEAQAWLVGWDNRRRDKCAFTDRFREQVTRLEGWRATESGAGA
jgi:acyl-CoA thioester hydrolase